MKKGEASSATMAAIEDDDDLRDRGESKIDGSRKRSRSTTTIEDELSAKMNKSKLMKKKLLKKKEKWWWMKKEWPVPLRVTDPDNCEKGYSLIALKHFNKVNNAQGGVVYELVEVVNFRFLLELKFWFHINFKAKPRNAPDSEAVLFFAEVLEQRRRDVVSCCCILNSGDPQGSCKGCSLIHPPTGFRQWTRELYSRCSFGELFRRLREEGKLESAGINQSV